MIFWPHKMVNNIVDLGSYDKTYALMNQSIKDKTLFNLVDKEKEKNQYGNNFKKFI